MDHVAKCFAFVSRSGEDSPQAARTVKHLRQAGAKAKVFCAVASDEEAVRGVLAQSKGALALHHAIKDLDLDFFVMTSSISAVLGNPGQSNYSAGNSFLDAMAVYRHHQGLPATSLVLPMVLKVGVVAENNAIETSLARKGLYGVDEQEMLLGFEAAMSQRQDPRASPLCANSQLIMGLDANKLADATGKAGGVGQADIYWYRDARFCHLRASIEGRDAQTGAGGGDVDDSFAVPR
ncbi:putative lovastatin nonaketide synthase [Diaporthe ampelina]|uniref:Putative lovastatin nonaketide synthase n=1 Tax=Diaporthe ampelina TaxID=1214573 RepID=A0A0G2FV51_9PEZI|nr:putative lovastatin nonaketide synthase [Diaporthe ampelina]